MCPAAASLAPAPQRKRICPKVRSLPAPRATSNLTAQNMCAKIHLVDALLVLSGSRRDLPIMEAKNKGSKDNPRYNLPSSIWGQSAHFSWLATARSSHAMASAAWLDVSAPPARGRGCALGNCRWGAPGPGPSHPRQPRPAGPDPGRVGALGPPSSDKSAGPGPALRPRGRPLRAGRASPGRRGPKGGMIYVTRGPRAGIRGAWRVPVPGIARIRLAVALLGLAGLAAWLRAACLGWSPCVFGPSGVE
jgi:hypothetical protein